MIVFFNFLCSVQKTFPISYIKRTHMECDGNKSNERITERYLLYVLFFMYGSIGKNNNKKWRQGRDEGLHLCENQKRYGFNW